MVTVRIRGRGARKPVADAVDSYVNIPASVIVHIERQKQNLIFQYRWETAGYGFCLAARGTTHKILWKRIFFHLRSIG